MMHAERLSTLGIRNLEDPDITNKSQRFNEESGNISRNFSFAISIITGTLSFLSAGIIIFKAIPIVALIFMLVVVIQFVSNQKFLRLLWIFNRDQTEARRSDNESLGYLTSPSALKELIPLKGTYFY